MRAGGETAGEPKKQKESSLLKAVKRELAEEAALAAKKAPASDKATSRKLGTAAKSKGETPAGKKAAGKTVATPTTASTPGQQKGKAGKKAKQKPGKS